MGKECKPNDRPELFAATPPPEALRFIARMCASKRQGTEAFRIFSSDVDQAYGSAPAPRPIFIEIFDEDKEPVDENMMARLDFSPHGTMDAAQNWQCEFTDKLIQQAFIRGQVLP